MAVSEENRALARYVHSIIGGTPSVTKYWDEAEKSSVDIMAIRDVPDERISTYATLGLSDTDTGLAADDLPLRIELLMAAQTRFTSVPNILATCAFNLINSGMAIRPGVIFSDVVRMYHPDSPMKHALFVEPFLWEVPSRRFNTKHVAWLQVVPISDAERSFADEHGSDALEDRFVERQIDVFTLDRLSVV